MSGALDSVLHDSVTASDAQGGGGVETSPLKALDARLKAA
jgi:hypothetical protein